MKFVSHRVENIVGKEENAGYHNVFDSRQFDDSKWSCFTNEPKK